MKTGRIGIIVGAILVMTFEPAIADGGIVRGYVVDTESHAAVTDATVFLRGPSGVFETQSGPDGFYVFLGILSGSYGLLATKPGFMPFYCVNGASVTVDEVTDLGREVALLAAPHGLLHITASVCRQPNSPPSLVDPDNTADVYDVH